MSLHSFSVHLAKKYGIDRAIMLGHLSHYIKYHERNKTNFFDGHHWTYDSAESLTKVFTYWTKNKIHKLLTKMEAEGLIESGDYSDNRAVRPKYYRICNGVIADSQTATSTGSQTATSTGSQMATSSLPDQSTNQSTDQSSINSSFEKFWIVWPTKKNKQGALKSFKVALNKQTDPIEEFTEMLVSDASRRIDLKQFGFDKLHATTYLNNSRWEDEYEINQSSITGHSESDLYTGMSNAQRQVAEARAKRSSSEASRPSMGFDGRAVPGQMDAEERFGGVIDLGRGSWDSIG